MIYAMAHTKSFISLYAMLLTFAVSLSGLHALQHLGLKKEITLSLYFQKQSMLYALSVRNIALQCLKSFGLNNCRSDEIAFGDGFFAQYIITNAKIKDLQHKDFNKDILLLDVSVYANTSLSTHALQHSRRFILKGKT